MVVLAIPLIATADSFELDFTSLPSTQSAAGSNWSYGTGSGVPESQIFSVGLNGDNEPTLFQDSIGTGSGARYGILDALDPAKTDIAIDVRAAVRQEQDLGNHFGFSFYLALGGVNLNVAIGENLVGVNEQTGFRTLASGLDNTDYHDYRLVGSAGVGGSWQLFRDGQLIGTGIFQAQPAENPQNELHLGDGSGGGNARAEVSVYRVSQSGECSVLNSAPIANAGADQSIRAGDTVFFDGVGSFDDNTDSADLLYSWSFSSLPAGSTASILGASSATPSLVVDLADTYAIELVVTDEGGLSSAPDEIVVSADNLAPSSSAGNDQLVVIGATVNFDGSASTDPEFDPLSYAWTITAAPASSTATIAGADTIGPSFIPDLEGTYQLILVASDLIGPGIPDTAQITAATAEDFSESQIVEASDYVAALVSGQVTTNGNQNALINFLIQAVNAIQAGNLATAIDKLEKALLRTDGCVLTGSPDGNGPGRDWVVDCTAQIEIYSLLNAALDALSE